MCVSGQRLSHGADAPTRERGFVLGEERPELPLLGEGLRTSEIQVNAVNSTKE